MLNIKTDIIYFGLFWKGGVNYITEGYLHEPNLRAKFWKLFKTGLVYPVSKYFLNNFPGHKIRMECLYPKDEKWESERVTKDFFFSNERFVSLFLILVCCCSVFCASLTMRLDLNYVPGMCFEALFCKKGQLQYRP